MGSMEILNNSLESANTSFAEALEEEIKDLPNGRLRKKLEKKLKKLNK